MRNDELEELPEDLKMLCEFAGYMIGRHMEILEILPVEDATRLAFHFYELKKNGVFEENSDYKTATRQ